MSNPQNCSVYLDFSFAIWFFGIGSCAIFFHNKRIITIVNAQTCHKVDKQLEDLHFQYSSCLKKISVFYIWLIEMAQPNITVDIHCSKKLDFVHCFRPVYYFSRIFGYMPFTFIYDSNGTIQELKVRVLDILWLILSIFIHIFIAIIYFRNEGFAIFNGTSDIIIKSDIYLMVLWLIFIILSITMDMCNRSNLMEILKKFNNFDENVRLCPSTNSFCTVYIP